MMQKTLNWIDVAFWKIPFLLFLIVPPLIGINGCKGTTPSARLEHRVALPVPATSNPANPTPPETDEDQTGPVRVTAHSLIHLAFDRQPDIKSSYQQFKSEEARYDFFYTSNDALTPRFKSSNNWVESRTTDWDDGGRIGRKRRAHYVEFGVDKQFFDTTELSLSSGLDSETDAGDWGSQPYLAAKLRYPLWESRKKLERTSEDIFRRNELNDAQLAYIERVREQLQEALETFYTVVDLRHRLAASERWRDDLLELNRRLENFADASDANRRRIAAELTRVNSQVRNIAGRLEVDTARLKYACGLPYETEIEIDEEPFNPFVGVTHEELRRKSVETDPEIATLRNAMRNAEVQLDLARRGKWDVGLILEGRGDFRGRGTESGNTEWFAAAGVEVSIVDARVTGSLQRQARASIERFKYAIEARTSLIYADTLEPLIRIDTLGASRDELAQNLQRFNEDYHTGVESFFTGGLNLDDLLTRRELIYKQEEEIAELSWLVGVNVAELCAATGKFFELLGLPPG